MTSQPTQGSSLPLARNFPTRSRTLRRFKDNAFRIVCVLAATVSTLVLVTLLTSVVVKAFGLTYSTFPILKQMLVGLGIFLLFVSVLASLILGVRVLSGTRGRAVPIWIGSLVLLLASGGLLFALAQAGESRSFLTSEFITSVPSRNAENAGIWPAMIGTLYVCAICAFFAIPIGVGTAVLLEEYSPKHPLLRRAHMFVQLNITNLAGVPSIVYGILGLTAFVNLFGLINLTDGAVPSVGSKWYERYQTEGGESVLVAVDGPETPSPDLAAATFVRESSMEPVEITIELEASLAPRREEAHLAVETFTDTFEDLLDATPSTTPERIAELADRAYDAAATLQVERAAIGAIARERYADIGPDTPRRERRRARRSLVHDVEELELQQRFALLLSDEAVGFKVDKKSPWYIQFPFGRSILAGGLTLMLVILPIIIIASQEALRAVPRTLRQGSLALGATHWQTTRRITLPSAVPGIMTGVILAMSRAIGEAAPLLIIAGIVYITFTPQNLMDQFTVMPLQIFEWARRPQPEFFQLAAAGIILLMSILLCINGLAIYIRHRMNRYQS